jgi:hypothetical protein
MYLTTENSIVNALQARDVLAQEQRDDVNAKVYIDSAARTADGRASLNTHVISSLDMVSFITALEMIESQSGARIDIASVDTDVTPQSTIGSTGKARAHVTLHGSWTTVMRALGIAEHLSFASSIDRVRLSKGGDAKAPWEASFDVQALVLVASSTIQ